MGNRSKAAHRFFSGLFTGAVGALVAGVTVLYALSITKIISISVIDIPEIQMVLGWMYDNLKLSLIPFTATLILYSHSLVRLRQIMEDKDPEFETVVQAEQILDVWINIFFGIGVIWTAIGMRGALLEGLGNLDAESAAKVGAFAILRRLVDGGILLALSTTIFGSVGGYIMRIIKTLTVGRKIVSFHNRRLSMESERVSRTLESIDRNLKRIVESTPGDIP